MFAELLDKVNSRTNKKLEDGSDMVKSGYATMMKLKMSCQSKDSVCLIGATMSSSKYSLFLQSDMSKFNKVKGHK